MFAYNLEGDRLVEASEIHQKFSVGSRVNPIQDFALVHMHEIGTIINYDPHRRIYGVSFDTMRGLPTDGQVIMATEETLMFACECGNSKNKVGQGHSYWCRRFKKEF
jgi:hypothetical protein